MELAFKHIDRRYCTFCMRMYWSPVLLHVFFFPFHPSEFWRNHAAWHFPSPYSQCSSVLFSNFLSGRISLFFFPETKHVGVNAPIPFRQSFTRFQLGKWSNRTSPPRSHAHTLLLAFFGYILRLALHVNCRCVHLSLFFLLFSFTFFLFHYFLSLSLFSSSNLIEFYDHKSIKEKFVI